MAFTQLVTVCSGLLRLCMKMYTMFRSLLYHKMFVNFRCRMYCIYTPGEEAESSLHGPPSMPRPKAVHVGSSLPTPGPHSPISPPLKQRRRRPLREHGWPDEVEVEWTVAETTSPWADATSPVHETPSRACGHFTDGGRGPLKTCTHPDGTSSDCHPLRGMERRFTKKQK